MRAEQRVRKTTSEREAEWERGIACEGENRTASKREASSEKDIEYKEGTEMTSEGD